MNSKSFHTDPHHTSLGGDDAPTLDDILNAVLGMAQSKQHEDFIGQAEQAPQSSLPPALQQILQEAGFHLVEVGECGGGFIPTPRKAGWADQKFEEPSPRRREEGMAVTERRKSNNPPFTASIKNRFTLRGTPSENVIVVQNVESSGENGIPSVNQIIASCYKISGADPDTDRVTIQLVHYTTSPQSSKFLCRNMGDAVVLRVILPDHQHTSEVVKAERHFDVAIPTQIVVDGVQYTMDFEDRKSSAVKGTVLFNYKKSSTISNIDGFIPL